jgi:probable HAF family extracellular repeat protein
MRAVKITMQVVATLAFAQPLHAQVQYSIHDLGIYPGGGASYGQAINASGQVTGSAVDSVSQYYMRAFRLAASGQIGDAGTSLGSLGGLSTYGFGINTSGQVTGQSQLPGNSFSPLHAFRTAADGSIIDLGTLGGVTSVGRGINDLGQVVGSSETGVNGQWHALRTTPGGMFDASADLGTFPGGLSSIANAINSTGQVTGGADKFSVGLTSYLPYRTSPTGTVATAEDLGTFGGTAGIGWSINDSGQVAGEAYFPGNLVQHAFRSSPYGQPIVLEDLGTLGGTDSYARGINSLGVVVGASQAAGDAEVLAFVFDTQMRSLSDLVPSGWKIEYANGINDAGQIIGYGQFQGGQTRAVLLTPVPEPSALLLAGLAGMGLVGRCRRRT